MLRKLPLLMLMAGILCMSRCPVLAEGWDVQVNYTFPYTEHGSSVGFSPTVLWSCGWMPIAGGITLNDNLTYAFGQVTDHSGVAFIQADYDVSVIYTGTGAVAPLALRYFGGTTATLSTGFSTYDPTGLASTGATPSVTQPQSGCSTFGHTAPYFVQNSTTTLQNVYTSTTMEAWSGTVRIQCSANGYPIVCSCTGTFKYLLVAGGAQ